MPSNIEIKARLADRPRVEAAVAAISDGPPRTLVQHDTFFNCRTGRLKLRAFGPGVGELIFYDRPDAATARQSDYEVVPVADPAALRTLLERALGATGVVEKTRVLYLVGQTRVHLDRVAGLGDFLELEVVLLPGQPAEEGLAIAADLMRRLGVDQGDLLSAAYADMLAAAVPPGPRARAIPGD